MRSISLCSLQTGHQTHCKLVAEALGKHPFNNFHVTQSSAVLHINNINTCRELISKNVEWEVAVISGSRSVVGGRSITGSSYVNMW